MALRYFDGTPVQVNDQVCIEPFEAGVEGKVTALFPKSGRAMVTFPEWTGRSCTSAPVETLRLLRRAK